jgi:hypothetical protein
MAITNYTELKSAVADWLNRADLAGVIPSFISLAESQFNRDERLRTRDAIVRATATIDEQFEALPSDYSEMQNFQINSQTPFRRLEFLTLNQMDEYKRDFTTAGVPKYYSIVGNQLEFLPVPGDSYTAEMVYYAKLTPLSDTNPTNWLLTKHPDIYLYGALIQTAPYLKDDERVGTWANLYERGLGDVAVSAERAMFAGSTIKIRTRAY